MSSITLQEVAYAIADRIFPGVTIIAGTGAGISCASGIPTFRGPEGIWNDYRVEDVATAEAFERDPGLFWRFHDHLREIIAGALPNAAHFALADMEEVLGEAVEWAIITQNIDGLHQRAGSEQVIELHGDALSYSCCRCEAPGAEVPIPAPEYPPLCDACGGVLRPDVVLFGEALPEQALADARDLAVRADVMLVVGTSGQVEPAASLPFITLGEGGLVVEVNPEPTVLTGLAQYSVQARAADALPLLWERVREALRED